MKQSKSEEFKEATLEMLDNVSGRNFLLALECANRKAKITFPTLVESVNQEADELFDLYS